MSEHAGPDAQAKSRLKSCALLALGPVVLLFALVIVFVVNNRPPNISIPTHKMPKDNGYDYFVRAGKMLGMQGPSSSATRQPNSWTVPELRQYVHSNAPALAVVREGLKRKCVLPAQRSTNAATSSYCGVRQRPRAGSASCG